jgi:ubiquinone/menaquinone biosynthesis C-methylase UbiE
MSSLGDSATEWDVVAPYYDKLFEDRIVDIPFWVTLARRFGSPILEFSCGTGRITFPIAQAGISVTGLDVSRRMLNAAIRKRRSSPPPIQKRIRLLKGNSINFQIPGKRFSAIFSAWGFHPVTKDEQDSCMRSVIRHLAPGGHFALDGYHYSHTMGVDNCFALRQYKQFPDQGYSLMRMSQSTYNPGEKLITTLFILDKISRNGSVRRFVSRRIERVYRLSDYIDLMKAHGFGSFEIYGDYDMSPFRKHSPRIIIIARHESGSLSG